MLHTRAGRDLVLIYRRGILSLLYTVRNTVLYPNILRATAATAVARLSRRNSVCPSVRLSVTRVDQSQTVQATITKSLSSAA